MPDAGVLAAVWAAGALGWLLLTWATRRFTRDARAGRGFGGVALLVLGGAFVLRAVPVGLLPVSLSDDVWRYVHDGRTLARGENPYVRSPAEDLAAAVAGGDAATARDLQHVNNKELVTIYQPTSQWVFAGAAALTRWAVTNPDAQDFARMLRGAFALIDLVVVVLLLAELRRRGRSAWWATLYAWCPAVFLETAWAGHQDGIGVLASVTCLTLAGRAGRGGRGGAYAAAAAGVALALAAGVKPVALPLALPLAWGLRARPRRVAVAAGACVTTLLALYVPFVLMEGGLTGMFETSRSFVTRWRFNGALHPLFEALAERLGASPHGPAKRVADAVCTTLLAGGLAVATWRLRDAWRVALVWFALMVSLSSTVHPWYLLWALGVLPVARAAAGAWGPFTAATWTAALALPWGYVAWLEMAAGRGYTVPVGVQVLCWAPVVAAAGVGWWLGRRRAAVSRPRA